MKTFNPSLDAIVIDEGGYRYNWVEPESYSIRRSGFYFDERECDKVGSGLTLGVDNHEPCR